MSETRTIYVDMDDVLCETARHLLVLLERELGKQMMFEDLTTFDLGQACRLRAHELDKLLQVAHHPDELLRIVPIEGAVAALQRWVDRGYEIAIVTGRPPTASEPSQEWLVRNHVPYSRFLNVDKYARFSDESPMSLTMEELARQKFCWAVEDSLSVATYVAERMRIPVALPDRPWNQADATHVNIHRHHHWSEIARTFPDGTR